MKFSFLVLVCCLAVFTTKGQRLVSHFMPVGGVAPTLASCETDASGNIYVSGNFQFVNRKLTGGLIKLKPDGKVDETFFVKPGPTGKKAYPLANGKVYLVGQYTLPNGDVTSLVRLNPDGALDPSFTSAMTSSVADLVVQSNGKIVVIGIFISNPNSGYPSLARLNEDGSLDETFAKHTFLTNQFGKGIAVGTDDNIYVTDGTKVLRLNPNGEEVAGYAGIGSDPQYRVAGMTALASGKVLVHGDFTRFNGVDATSMVRLNADGTVDQTFSFAGAGAFHQGDIITELSNGNLLVVPGNAAYNSGFIELQPNGTFLRHLVEGSGVFAMAESNGGVIIVGQFTTIAGSGAHAYIARVKSTGEFDASFETPQVLAAGYDLPMIADSQGRLVVGGLDLLRAVLNNGISTPGPILRLTPTGDHDNTFVAGTPANSYFWSGYLQSDGKYVLGGVFFGSSPTPILVRLNADGTADNSFVTGTTTSSQGRIVKFSGNSIYLTGQWAEYNGTTTGGFVRLNADGSLAQTYTAWQQFGVARDFDVQQDGRVLFSGSTPTNQEVLIRFNTDGTLDSSFPGLNFVSGRGRAIAIDANGFAYVGGSFNSVGSIAASMLVKLQSDGTQAPGFDTGTGFTGTLPQIWALQILPTGNIAVAGNFSGYRGVTCNGFVIIDPTGAVVPAPDVSFGAGTVIRRLLWHDNALYVSGLMWNPELTELSTFRKISFATGASPAAPDNLVLAMAAGGAFNISWTDKSSNEAAFMLERSTSPTSGFVTVKALPANTTSFKDSVLTHETVYYYRVKASGDSGDSGYSNVASMTMLVLGVELETPFSVYPNPCRDFIVANTNMPGTWNLISATGSVSILRADLTDQESFIYLGGAAPGIYVLRFSCVTGTLMRRIAVIR